MNLVDRYVARTVLGAIALVMAVLLVLGALFNFIDQQASVGVGHYDMIEALAYSLLNLPRFALNAFPAGVLIGAMLGIGALARSHELTAVRSAGMSRWRLAATMLGCGLLLLVIGLVIGEFIAPRLEQYADERKAIARDGNVSLAGSGGAWVRDGNLVINIAERSSAVEFGGVMVFELSPDNRLISVAHADRADSGPGKSWQLGGYTESRFAGDTVSSQSDARRELHTAVSDTFLQMAVVQPSEMALAERLRAMRYLRANRQDYRPYSLAFWSGLARSAAIPLGVLFALPFGFGSMRSAGSGARTTLGLVIALVYFFLQRTVESGTVAFSLNPLLLAWVPTFLLGTAAMVLLLRTR
ncbi:MAG: LPS export ABC transporter permease LptG [Steroidobacteraceae bacterium]